MKMTIATIKKAIRNAEMNPSDFEISNNAGKIEVTAKGIYRTFQEEIKMTSNADFLNEVFTRQATAENLAETLIEKIGADFDYFPKVAGCRTAGMEIFGFAK